MSHRIACLSAVAASLLLAGLPRPAAAADYYDEGRGPSVFHGRGAGDDGEDAIAPRRPRGGPGPVVFDERDPGRQFGPGFPRREADFGPGEGRGFGPGGPVLVERPAFRYGPGFERPLPAYGVVERPLPRYRAVAAPIAADAYDDGYGAPDVGCTVEQAQSTTPAGWRKTVTHRTCYRR